MCNYSHPDTAFVAIRCEALQGLQLLRVTVHCEGDWVGCKPFRWTTEVASKLFDPRKQMMLHDVCKDNIACKSIAAEDDVYFPAIVGKPGKVMVSTTPHFRV